MPAPSTCVVSGTLYDAGGAPLPNTVVTFLMPQQVIGGATVSQSIISTITDSLGALSPVALPQTAIVFVTIAAGMMVRGIVPAAATGSIAALLSGTVFSGSLAGATIQVNSNNLQSQLVVNFLDGRDITITNPSGGNVKAEFIPFLRDATEFTAVSSDVEIPLFTDGIAGGTLGTAGVIRGWADILINSMLNNSTCVFRLKFGGVSFFVPTLINTSGSTQGNFPVHFEFNIRARGTTNAQNVFAHVFLQPVNPTGLYFGGSGLLYSNGRASLFADSTLNQSLQLSAQWSAADASNSLTGDGMFAF